MTNRRAIAEKATRMNADFELPQMNADTASVNKEKNPR
jgi:hypothetical protein